MAGKESNVSVEGQEIDPDPVAVGFEENPRTSYVKIVLVSIVVGIVVVFLVLFAASTLTVAETFTMYENETRDIEPARAFEVINLFADYIDNPRAYEGEEIILVGYLESDFVDEGTGRVLQQRVVDMIDNAIPVTNLKRVTTDYFPTRGRTENAFEVRGTFDRNFNQILIDPITVTPFNGRPEQIGGGPTTYVYYKNSSQTRVVPRFPALYNAFRTS